MRQALALAATLVLTALSGCASYASMRLEEGAEAERKPEVFGEIEKWEFEKHVQVKLPAELVVAEVRNKVDRGRDDTADKRAVQLVDALALEKSTFADVAPLFADAVPGGFDRLRISAARHHADLLLVTSMTERVRDESGAAQSLKLLLLPTFLVPTETNDLTLHVRAAIVDVRNSLVYATFEDHHEERVRSTAVGEKDAIEAGFDRLYAASLEKMRTRVTERLRTLERVN